MRNCKARTGPEGNIDKFFLQDNGIFPNNELPVLHYRQVIDLPRLFPAKTAKKLLQQNGWSNNWKAGIFTYHHYHSNTHEAMIVIDGKTMILLGGENGTIITLKKGDAIVIPAGVAHKNLGKESSIVCVGGYPEGIDYDMQYGAPGERPVADKIIQQVELPATGPVCGTNDPLLEIWKESKNRTGKMQVMRDLS